MTGAGRGLAAQQQLEVVGRGVGERVDLDRAPEGIGRAVGVRRAAAAEPARPTCARVSWNASTPPSVAARPARARIGAVALERREVALALAARRCESGPGWPASARAARASSSARAEGAVVGEAEQPLAARPAAAARRARTRAARDVLLGRAQLGARRRRRAASRTESAVERERHGEHRREPPRAAIRSRITGGRPGRAREREPRAEELVRGQQHEQRRRQGDQLARQAGVVRRHRACAPALGRPASEILPRRPSSRWKKAASPAAGSSAIACTVDLLAAQLEQDLRQPRKVVRVVGEVAHEHDLAALGVLAEQDLLGAREAGGDARARRERVRPGVERQRGGRAAARLLAAA